MKINFQSKGQFSVNLTLCNGFVLFAFPFFRDDVSLPAHFIQIHTTKFGNARTEWELFFCQRITILCRQMSHDNCPFGFF